MSPPIVDGTPVDAATTNPQFLDKTIDDTTVGRVTLANPLSASGATVTSAQTQINAIDSFVGVTANSVYNILPTWTNNDVGSSTDYIKLRVDLITAKFNASTGHTHSGSAGDGGPIAASSLTTVPFRGIVQQGTDLVAVTGTSTNVSTQLTGKTASSGTTSLGVVVTAPNNKIVIRNSSNDAEYVDGTGNVVYGRLTKSGSVWTLSYYSEIVGTETAYTFSSSGVRWYYQELFNPMVTGIPVYSEFASIPSDSATADVITATTTLQGKVSLSSAAAADVTTAGSAGTANASVANANHAHKGVFGVNTDGSTNIFGAVQFSGAGGSVSSQLGQIVTITSPALSTGTPASVGSSNSAGSGTTSSKFDHVHQGVHGINTDGSTNIFSDVQISGAGGSVSSQSGQIVTVTSPALSSTSPAAVAGTAAVGTGTTSARSDHAHVGVHSIAKSSGDTTQLFADVTVTAGSNMTITRSGNDLSFASTAAGSGQQVVFGTAQTSNGSRTNTAYGAFTNNPTVSITPTTTGTFEVSLSSSFDSSSAAATAAVRINATVGSPTLLVDGEMIWSQDSASFNTPQLVRNFYTLTASTAYTFVLEGKTSSGTITIHSSELNTGSIMVARQVS